MSFLDEKEGEDMNTIVVVGAGASGILAAYSASLMGARVILLEKNNMIGRKIRITGKGRCNVTSKNDIEDIIKNIYKNSSFMYSSLYTYSNEDLIRDLENNGLRLKTERGNRVFPESDKAIDVVMALEKMISDKNIDIRLNSRVKEVMLDIGSDNKKVVNGVILSDGRKILSDAVIVCTGGASYPLTGSNGDGYSILKKLGHNITNIKPGLIGLETDEKIEPELVGLLLKNVEIKLYDGNKVIYKDFGEIEYRNYGIDGAIVKKASCYMRQGGDYRVEIDLKPALSFEKLDNRIQRDFQNMMNHSFKDVFKGLLPSKIINHISKRLDVDLDKKIHQVTREERLGFVKLLKKIDYKILRTRPIDEAIITDGGVSIKEINPSTMESKLVENLYISGEVIDVEAYTGGYNLQIAFSTGYLAGLSSATKIVKNNDK